MRKLYLEPTKLLEISGQLHLMADLILKSKNSGGTRVLGLEAVKCRNLANHIDKLLEIKGVTK